MGPFEYFLREPVRTGTLGKVNHIDLGIWEKLVGMFIEQEQSYIQGPQKFFRASHNVHLAAELREVYAGGVGIETAAEFLEEISD